MATKKTRFRQQAKSAEISSINTTNKVQNLSIGDQLKPSDYFIAYKCWCPRPSIVFNVLLSARITAAFLSNISDCDETFNYWEPAHYLIYGSGFQTWEYSPAYAIRSYAYILLHTIPAQLVKSIFDVNKLVLFYYIRFMLAVFCAGCETYFYKGVVSRFGEHVGRLTFAFLVFSTGMFISSSAFLPSSFSMCCCMIGFGGWFNRNYTVAIFGIAVASLVGWPFCAVLGIPIAYDLIVCQYKVTFFCQWAIGAFAAIMIPMVSVDSGYYGKQVIAPLNIVLYNVFGKGGPDLYGTEPWTFYFLNGFLNFNLVFVLAIASLPVCVMLNFLLSTRSGAFGRYIPIWLVLSPLYIWFSIFFTQPHKEERFLFPVYPYICLSAALALSYLQKLYHQIFTAKYRQHFSSSSNWLALLIVGTFALLSLSRSAALYTGYHAPLDAYGELFNQAYSPTTHEEMVYTQNKELRQPSFFAHTEEVNLCVGKEWYRYPSSFFLPSDSWNLRFIVSEFRGQLPKPYALGEDATKIIPSDMNDMNREEKSRYTPTKECDLVVDLTTQEETKREPNFANYTKRWEVIYSRQFVDAARSHRIFRAFYIPFVSHRYLKYSEYVILRTKKKRRRLVNVVD